MHKYVLFNQTKIIVEYAMSTKMVKKMYKLFHTDIHINFCIIISSICSIKQSQFIKVRSILNVTKQKAVFCSESYQGSI